MRLKEAVLDLKVSSAWDLDTFINPIVSFEDRDRLRKQIREAAHEATREGGEVLVDRSEEILPGTCSSQQSLFYLIKSSLMRKVFLERSYLDLLFI